MCPALPGDCHDVSIRSGRFVDALTRLYASISLSTFWSLAAGDVPQILPSAEPSVASPIRALASSALRAFGVVELRSFQVAVLLGNIAKVVERKRTVRIEGVGLEKVFLGRRPVIFDSPRTLHATSASWPASSVCLEFCIRFLNPRRAVPRPLR